MEFLLKHIKLIRQETVEITALVVADNVVTAIEKLAGTVQISL